MVRDIDEECVDFQVHDGPQTRNPPSCSQAASPPHTTAPKARCRHTRIPPHNLRNSHAASWGLEHPDASAKSSEALIAFDPRTRLPTGAFTHLGHKGIEDAHCTGRAPRSAVVNVEEIQGFASASSSPSCPDTTLTDKTPVPVREDLAAR